MELGVGTLFSTSVGSVSGPGVGDVLDDSRHGALREDSKPWAAVKRTMRQRRSPSERAEQLRNVEWVLR